MKVWRRNTSARIPVCPVLAAIFVMGAQFLSFAQNPQLETKNGLAFATVIFSHAFATETPRFYSIAIDSTGSTTYQSAPASLQQTGVPYTMEFTASPEVKDKAFRIVGELTFLRPPVSGIRRPMESESVNTLTFREGRGSGINPANINSDNEVSYHSSTNTGIEQLTEMFEGISETLEFGRQLANLHQQRSPQMNIELQHMLDLTRRHRLLELFVVAPVLQQIASDVNIQEAARQRARAILHYAEDSPH
jgi:hypothetical protein